ncbi:response regulator with CheY-like receiver domain and winged-helix DNA-binding domain [Sanguibacter keddieii DSM 10542]|uniref:Response regulator with CheY-like receiver domain and winged-helix DNA-binding domain n=1 Tax=Sanguibacter keddieii (strain ATCC 51767 / DSM 10542 / NCFB 3025 / ST-74) TaxID=446469 RepID=D1BIS5_SANKS|nr:response regulator transcription factor [Sanguibacter keddieii]ACZ20117.1 response regulator with CheY-like receiver domain and winged-helix DNA-binding domain [Sanguibacter keddieii DSM 10542]
MAPDEERRTAVIIEDDADIRHLLEAVLSDAGFHTIATGNGIDGVQAVKAYEPIVTTLDMGMPGIDGLETARRIRQFSQTYLVIVSARSEEIDTLQALDAGADDYLTKPFRPRELRARIDAMLRRPRVTGGEPAIAAAAEAATAAPAAQVPQAAPEVPTGAPEAHPVGAHAAPTAMSGTPGADVTAGTDGTDSTASEQQQGEGVVLVDEGEGWLVHRGLRLNPDMRLVRYGQEEIVLTRSEFDLLSALMETGRRVRGKADLALLLRGESYVTSYYVSEADKRAIEVHMANLRRKLSDTATSPRWIETVRGVGYRLTSVDET